MRAALLPVQASSQYAHLQEHATFLDTRTGMTRFGGLVGKSLGHPDSPLLSLDEKTPVDKQKFKELLGKIDSGLRALPATAQVRRAAEAPGLGDGPGMVDGHASQLLVSAKTQSCAHICVAKWSMSHAV